MSMICRPGWPIFANIIRLDKITILLVDNISHNLNGIMRRLRRVRNADYAIHAAGDSSEALALLTGCHPCLVKVSPDLIVVDIDTPEVNGIEFLRVVRSYLAFSSIKVIAMTGSQAGHEMLAARRLGVSGYIPKPVNFMKPGSSELSSLCRAISESR